MNKSIWKLGLLVSSVTGALLFAPIACEAQKPTAPQTSKKSEARFGVNIAVAEFGNDMPGKYGQTYTYPEPSELDYYKAKGRTLIRFPFKWERMQRTLNGPLDAAELGYLKAFMKAAGERKMDVILDVHNYGRYLFPNEPVENMQIIGSDRLPVAAFADLWTRLAENFKNEPALYGYGLMNEPHDMGDGMRWPRAAQAAIDAIRKVDKKTTIFVSGDAFASATSWRNGLNETINEKISDPQKNMVFEAHCYFDKTLEGAYRTTYDQDARTPDSGIEHVRPFVEWCKEKGVRGFIGEFGVPDNDPRWLVTMDRFLGYLKANDIGGTYWAGGPWWNDYILSIEPKKADATTKGTALIDRPQMLVLQQYAG